MITIYYQNVKENELKTLETYKVGAWLHMENPSDEEILSVTEELKLEESLIYDALDLYEVPRIEREEDKDYIFTRFVITHGATTATSPLLIVMGEGVFITVSRDPVPILPLFIQGKVPFFTTQKTKLFIQLLLAISQDYQRHINSIGKQIRNNVSNVEHIKNRDIAQFVRFETIFNDFLGALQPTNTLLSKVLSGSYLKLFDEDKDLVEDLLLTNGQLIETSKANLAQISSTREAYSTIISNNLNKTMKLLTSVTLLLTVPTMIASFYGMNVELPYQNHPLAFVFIVLSTLIITIFLLYVFFKNDYF